MTDYLKIPEVARRLDVSEPTARRMIKGGKLPSVFVGGAYRVSEEDLAEYLEDAKVRVGDPSPKESPTLDMPDEQFEVLVREADESGLSEMMADLGRYLPRQGEEQPSRRSVIAIHRCVFIARERKARAAAELEKLEKLQIA